MTCYFMFSQGSYSDYSVGGLYVCDHAVTKAEWDEHYKAYQEQLEAKRLDSQRTWALRLHPEAVEIVHQHHWRVDWTSWWASEERELFSKWEQDNDPEKTFQEKHGMIAIECTEMWRD